MNRAAIKERAKFVFKATYWKSVLVAFVASLLVGGVGGGTSSRLVNSDTAEMFTDLDFSNPQVLSLFFSIFIMMMGLFLVALIVAVLLDVFVLNPLSVGCCRFFFINARVPAEPREMGFGFKNGYGNIIVGMFLRDLFIWLWSLLFIIPGIIKSYSYRMVPYILAENPGMSGLEAITLSKEMMYGHKWEAFVLDLSFLGWFILSGLTCGILYIFYVGPYYENTNAEYFYYIRYCRMHNGSDIGYAPGEGT